ncbi:MAG: hypothetical protein R2854_29550 [Caldilineaceae bacterium]
MFRKRRAPNLAFNYIIILLVFFALSPLIVLFFNSVKSTQEVVVNPLGPPRAIHLENYPNAWKQGNFSVTTRNTLILVTGTVLGVLVFGGLAAYGLARLDPPGSNGFMVRTHAHRVDAAHLGFFLVPLFSAAPSASSTTCSG